MEENKTKNNSSKKWIITACAAVIVIIAVTFYISSQAYETTENAQVDGDIFPLRSGLSGYVQKVKFIDNQDVKKGDTLLILNNIELKADVKRIAAELEGARTNVKVSGSLADAQAENAKAASLATSSDEQSIQSSKANLDRAEQELKRGQLQLDIKGITQDYYEQLQTQLSIAKAIYLKALAQKQSTSSTSNGLMKQAVAERQQVTAAEAIIIQKEAELEAALERLKHAYIIAPSDGIVTKRALQEGQYILTGQALFAIVNYKKVWVTANFKETQLSKLKPGQQVEIKVDAFKELTLHGTIESYGGATGSRFALVPPDNATGNFIKIAQRFPIRIQLQEGANTSILYPGLSATVKVKIN